MRKSLLRANKAYEQHGQGHYEVISRYSSDKSMTGLYTNTQVNTHRGDQGCEVPITTHLNKPTLVGTHVARCPGLISIA